MPPIFYIKNGFLHFGNKTILQDIELYIYPGDKICLIGRNGAGKSSLMKIIFGLYELDHGELFKLPTTSLNYLTQHIEHPKDPTIYNFILSQFANQAESKYKADMILSNLGLDGNLELNTLSGGQARRAALAKVLVLEPDILLLDEPTNHLDITTIEWLEEYVQNYKGAIICISHDRAFLSNTTNKIWWIDRGVLRKADQGFKYFDSWQETIIEQEEAVLRKMNKKLALENEWLNAGVTARRKRNQRRLTHLRSLRESLRSSTNKLLQAKQKLNITLEEEVKKTNFIIEVDGLSFGYGGKKVIDNFGFKVKKGEKIGIIGPNGSGKSTFIKLLTKEIKPTEGRIKYGTNLEISYIDQHKVNLNPDHSLKQILCPTGGDQVFLQNKTQHVAAYLKQFMFDPKALNDKVVTLSGGQISRLLLAKMLIKPGNLLILDEPTNDLDMDSLEMLLEILAEYSGTLIVVSHDRDFLERLVTRTLIFAGKTIIDLIGGYEDYKKFTQDNKPIKAVSKSNNKPARVLNEESLAPSLQPKKLSYKYQRALVVIPEEIKNLEVKIALLEEKLEDADLYITDTQLFNQISKELQYSRQKIEELMEEWVDIENKYNTTFT